MNSKGHPHRYIEFVPYGYPLAQALLCYLQLPLGAVPCHWHLCCPAVTSVALTLLSQLQDIQGLLTKPQLCYKLHFSLTYQRDPGTPHQNKTKQNKQPNNNSENQTKPKHSTTWVKSSSANSKISNYPGPFASWLQCIPQLFCD